MLNDRSTDREWHRANHSSVNAMSMANFEGGHIDHLSHSKRNVLQNGALGASKWFQSIAQLYEASTAALPSLRSITKRKSKRSTLGW